MIKYAPEDLDRMFDLLNHGKTIDDFDAVPEDIKKKYKMTAEDWREFVEDMEADDDDFYDDGSIDFSKIKI